MNDRMTTTQPSAPPRIQPPGVQLPRIKLAAEDRGLRTSTQPVRSFDRRLRGFVDAMFAVVRAARGLGLAANQLGVSRSVFVLLDGSVRVVVVNPVLDLRLVPMVMGSEVCLSAPGERYLVPRAVRALVVGQDEFGQPVGFEAEGRTARYLQHLIDHLRGGLPVDRLREAPVAPAV